MQASFLDLLNKSSSYTWYFCKNQWYLQDFEKKKRCFVAHSSNPNSHYLVRLVTWKSYMTRNSDSLAWLSSTSFSGEVTWRSGSACLPSLPLTLQAPQAISLETLFNKLLHTALPWGFQVLGPTAGRQCNVAWCGGSEVQFIIVLIVASVSTPAFNWICCLSESFGEQYFHGRLLEYIHILDVFKQILFEWSFKQTDSVYSVCLFFFDHWPNSFLKWPKKFNKFGQKMSENER